MEPTIGVRNVQETVVSENPHNSQSELDGMVEVRIVDNDDPAESVTAFLSQEAYDNILSGQCNQKNLRGW